VQNHPTPEADGAIVITVTDPIGAVIRKAQVSVFNDKRIPMMQGETDSLGRFEAHGLAPGYYSFEVKAFGFRTAESSNIEIQPGLQETKQISMGMGAAVMGGPIVVWNPTIEPDTTHIDDLLPLLPVPTTPAPNQPNRVKRLFKSMSNK
jgi:Carboxypeptidase regulatory-like domain